MRERAENIKKLVRELSEFSEVTILEDRAIISLISNIDKAAEVLATTFTVMDRYCFCYDFVAKITFILFMND